MTFKPDRDLPKIDSFLALARAVEYRRGGDEEERKEEARVLVNVIIKEAERVWGCKGTYPHGTGECLHKEEREAKEKKEAAYEASLARKSSMRKVRYNGQLDFFA